MLMTFGTKASRSSHSIYLWWNPEPFHDFNHWGALEDIFGTEILAPRSYLVYLAKLGW